MIIFRVPYYQKYTTYAFVFLFWAPLFLVFVLSFITSLLLLVLRSQRKKGTECAKKPVSIRPNEYFSKQIKIKSSLYQLYYAEACNELAEPISTSLRPGNTSSSFQGNVAVVTSCWQYCIRFDRPRFESQASRSRDESVINIWRATI